MELFKILPCDIQLKIIDDYFKPEHKDKFYYDIKYELFDYKINKIFNGEKLKFNICLDDFIDTYDDVIIKNCSNGVMLKFDLNSFLFYITGCYEDFEEDTIWIDHLYFNYENITNKDLIIIINEFIEELMTEFNIKKITRCMFLEIMCACKNGDGVYEMDVYFGS